MRKNGLTFALLCCVFAMVLGLAGCGGSGASSSQAGASTASASAASASSSTATPQDPDAEFLPALAAGLEARWQYSDKIAGQELTAEVRKQLAQYELDEIAPFKGASFKDPELGKLAERYIAAVEESVDCLSLIDTDYVTFTERWSDAYAERALTMKELVEKYGFTMADAHKASLESVIEDAKEEEGKESVPSDIQKAANEDIPAALESAFKKSDDNVYRATTINSSRASFDRYNFCVLLLNDKGGLAEQFSLGTENWGSGAEASFEFTPSKEFATIAVISEKWYATWQI